MSNARGTCPFCWSAVACVDSQACTLLPGLRPRAHATTSCLHADCGPWRGLHGVNNLHEGDDVQVRDQKQREHEMAGPREEEHRAANAAALGRGKTGAEKVQAEKVKIVARVRVGSLCHGRPLGGLRAQVKRHASSVSTGIRQQGQTAPAPSTGASCGPPSTPAAAQCSTLCPKALMSDSASERAGEGGGRRLPRSDSPSARPGMDSGGTCIRGGST